MDERSPAFVHARGASQMRSAVGAIVALGLIATGTPSEAGDVGSWEGGPTIRVDPINRNHESPAAQPSPSPGGNDTGNSGPATPSFRDQQRNRIAIAQGKQASAIGLKAYKKGLLDEALKNLEVAVRAGVEHGSTLAQVQNERGVQLFESAAKLSNATEAQRRYRVGRELVERAVANNPNSDRYRKNLAEMHETWCGRNAKLVPATAGDDWFSTTAGKIYLGHVERAQAAGWRDCHWFPSRGGK
jgi:hypothetical protein